MLDPLNTEFIEGPDGPSSSELGLMSAELDLCEHGARPASAELDRTAELVSSTEPGA